MASLLDTALEWQTAGASIVPTSNDGKKRPGLDEWKPYQATPPTTDELRAWFANGAYEGLGVITGKVSGNLEMLEVEGRALHLDIGQALTDHGLHDVWHNINNGCVEVTPNGGIHWHYRVDGPAARNTKIARRPATVEELADNPDDQIKVMIETRGEGGFTILAPSNGATHPSGRPWTRMGGSPANIPTITVAERDAIHHILHACFDQMPLEPAREPRPSSDPGEGLRPGDDYAAKTDWADILEPEGWRRVGRVYGGNQSWVRPGKNPRDGASATTKQTATGDWLYVFSTSTIFEAERAYSKFAAYTLLHHNGDYTEAAKQLRRDGYGDDRPFPAPTPLPAASNGTTTQTATVTQVGTEIHSGQLRMAQRLAANYPNQHLNVPHLGWYHWDGKRWAEDEGDHQARRTVITIIRDAILESAATGDKKLRADATRCESDNGIKGVLGCAATLLTAPAALLDADPYVINVANGTLDLHTMQLRPHHPDDKITKVCNAAYDPDATGHLWHEFLAQVLPDQAVRDYLQRYVGTAACGLVLEHVLAILTGQGRNGKGVFYGRIIHALGDYAQTADPDLFMHREGAHPTGEMDLRGARFVVVSESDKHRRLAEATVKRLTGGDEIKARKMRQDFVSFQPSHTPALVTNHLPKVSGDDPALWERIRVIPFNVVIPKADRDKHLAEKLTLEADAILTWIVTGWAEYQRRDSSLDEPAAVLTATDAYHAKQDAIGGFITERCYESPNHAVPYADLWAAWRKYADEVGVSEQDVSKSAFGEYLEKRGFPPAKGKGNKAIRRGLTLLSEDEEGE